MDTTLRLPKVMAFTIFFSLCSTAAWAKTGVFLNRVELSANQLAQLKSRHGIAITPGRHWYDRMTGAWGYVGHATAGFIKPGLNVGGELWRSASNGKTGVIVNGRELHIQDVIALQSFGVPVQRGRYWLNAFGVGGYEGGPPLFNLALLARQNRPSRSAQRRPNTRRGSALSTWDLTGVAVY